MFKPRQDGREPQQNMIDLGPGQYRNAVASGSSDGDANSTLPRYGTDPAQVKRFVR